MPDISMCRRDDCPKKLECYRFTAKPDSYQSYILLTEVYPLCERFMKNNYKRGKKVKHEK